ncbi:cellulose biosynthesis cyclic di-GMP-binding regulatory protein BcsB [Paraliobacillus sp. JSM ZJ581]|uniref:cellulose biosynthesis cyclic di-GMP-binding regulatory protein BcsB n=1 Tax=Paraliobacillus sp. JSM ZJ581 TaxID=3342118 RepID=UPI0035A8C900
MNQNHNQSEYKPEYSTRKNTHKRKKANTFYLSLISLVMLGGVIYLLTPPGEQVANSIKTKVSVSISDIFKKNESLAVTKQSNISKKNANNTEQTADKPTEASNNPNYELEVIASKDKKEAKASAIDNGEVLILEQDDITLNGVYGGRDFYFTLPRKNIGNKSYLELVVSSSDLLIEDLSSLTVLINEQPIQSISIKNSLEFKSIKIPLHRDFLTDGVNKISIQTQTYINTDVCFDQIDAANWMILHKTSYAFIDTKKSNDTKDLLNFYPYPFVTPGTQEEIHTSIVIPNNSSGDVMKAALQLGQYLSKQTTAKNIVPIFFENEWNDNISEHVIALGELDAWEDKIANKITFKDISLQSNELYLTNVLEKSEKSSKQVLFVTANNEQTLIEKSTILTDDKLVSQLTGNALKIGSMPEIDPSIAKAERTLPLVNEPITLNDSQLNSETFYLDIPSYWNIKNEATLNLSFRASPLLKEWNDSNLENQLGLTVYINDVPHTVPLAKVLKGEVENEKNVYNYSFNVPTELLLNQELVAIHFEFNNPNTPEECRQRYKSGNWVTIEKDSVLDVPHEIDDNLSFTNWPAPLIKTEQNNYDDVAFVIPESIQKNGLNQIALLVNNLASHYTFNNYQIVRGNLDELDQDIRSEHHLVILKAANDNFYGDKNQLIVPWSTEGKPDLASFGFITETASYVSWMQPSIWNEEKTMVFFKSLDTDEEAPYIHKEFFQSLSTIDSSKQSQILVINKADEVNSFGNDENNKNEKVVQESVNNNTKILIIVFSTILLVGVIVFLIIWRKKKKNE